MLKLKIFSLSILLFTILSNKNLDSQQAYKSIDIQGLKIFSKDFILNKFKLTKLKLNESHFKRVANKINYFYQKKGYHLVITYLVKETKDSLTIYIDEGKLGQIKFINLNTIKTLQTRYDFHLEKDIYNAKYVEKELSRLKKKHKYRNIYATLVKSKDYKKSAFQLDGEIDIPYLGKTSLPFFEKYGYRYHLEIHVFRNSSANRSDFSMGLKFRKSKGISPFLLYEHNSFLAPKDKWTARTSMGIMYLLDFQPKKKPYWTYMDFETSYYFKPTLKEFFTPRVNGSIYRSKSSRPDLGLSHYEYLNLRTSFEPGITLLHKLKIYAGMGVQKTYFYKSKVDQDASYVINVNEHESNWLFFASKMEVNKLIDSEQTSFLPRLDLRYTFYRNDESFHEVKLFAGKSFELTNFETYTLDFEVSKLWRNVPFHHEIPVSNSIFKGFMGKGYHTRQIARIENELYTSIYKDYIHFGVFFDYVYFQGSGYDLTGTQHGIVGGPALQTILFDQFQLAIYYGKDYLYSKKESQYNLYFYLKKRW